MAASAIATSQPSVSTSASATHRLALGLVWLTVALGGVVFPEPAPADLLTMGLIPLLPIIGLVSFEPPLILLSGMLLTAAGAAFIGATNAFETNLAVAHTGITLHLYLATIVFAAFIAKRPGGHCKLVLDAHLCAAMLAATAGIVGYFDLIPGAYEAMTRYGRATALFKDPNVFGPFLVLAILYGLGRIISGSTRRTPIAIFVLPILSLGMFLSFSRGAWLNFGIGVCVYIVIQFFTAPTHRMRLKLIFLGVAAAAGFAALVALSIQFDRVADLLAERSALTQEYDEGPEGRFGGQQKAASLILQHPLGVGAQQFAPHFHHEEPHNTYLALFLNGGWLGGLVFLAVVACTALHGLRFACSRSPHQPMFLAAYAAFIGHAAEAVLIDIDHWRHFYLLIAIIWGLMANQQRYQRPAA